MEKIKPYFSACIKSYMSKRTLTLCQCDASGGDKMRKIGHTMLPGWKHQNITKILYELYVSRGLTFIKAIKIVGACGIYFTRKMC